MIRLTIRARGAAPAPRDLSSIGRAHVDGVVGVDRRRVERLEAVALEYAALLTSTVDGPTQLGDRVDQPVGRAGLGQVGR